MSVFWVVFPKLRPLYAICIGAADAGLVLLNLHFVSDVVAGTFVGVSTGMFTVALCSPNFRENSLNRAAKVDPVDAIAEIAAVEDIRDVGH